MTRYFVDTEFIDNKKDKTIDLISIGITGEDGREYYAQSTEFNHKKASPWVKEHVLKKLLMCPHAEPSKHGIAGLYRADRAYHHKFGGQCIDQQRGYIHQCPWRTRDQLKVDILAFMDIEKHGIPELWGYYSAYDHVVFCQLFGTMMDLPKGYPYATFDLYQLSVFKGLSVPAQKQENEHNALVDARWNKDVWMYLNA